MESSTRLAVVLAGCLMASGCGETTDHTRATNHPKATVLVFDISKVAPLPDGRPVIDVQPKGKWRPKGTGPSGDYFLMVRKNGSAYYTRIFNPQEAEEGVQLDLAIPTREVKPGDKLTVAVENVNPMLPSDYVRLSNVLQVPHPPPSARSFAIRRRNFTD